MKPELITFATVLALRAEEFKVKEERVDLLAPVRALIGDPAHPERWTQGADARTKDGDRVTAKEATAVCWCLSGAIVVMLPKSVIRERVTVELNRRAGMWFVDWNDADGRTHAEVVELLKEPLYA